MANIGNHEIFFGAVFGGNTEKLPSWFPNVNPVKDLKDHFGNDISEHYVDFAIKINVSVGPYLYIRCYCDAANSVTIYSPNGTQIFLTYINSGSKIAFREIQYSSDGTVYNYIKQSWLKTNTILSNNFDSSKLCVIGKGKPYNVNTYNLIFQVL